MRYLLVFGLTLVLTGCLGDGSKPALPPELQGNNPLNTELPPVGNDPLSEFPLVVTPEDSTTPVVEEEAPVQTTDPVTASVSSGPDCTAIVEDLETSFEDMNFCDTDSDCDFAEGSCPFGCYLFHHKKIDFADYQPTLDTYRESCTPCEYKCASPPRPSNLRCREGRCVDTRYDS